MTAQAAIKQSKENKK